MIKSVLDYLDNTAARFPNKVGYTDENTSLTFEELRTKSSLIGAALTEYSLVRKPVAVYMKKRVEQIVAFLAARHAGAFYVPLDIDSPFDRIDRILSGCGAEIVLTCADETVPEEISSSYRVLCIEDLEKRGGEKEDADKVLADLRRWQIDTDPIYAIFTSGSTGMPKGVLISERSAINFTEWWCETFEFTDEEVFANQTPFYFDASVKDIYATLRCGATMHIVPQKLFSLPVKLVEFLNETKTNCIDWVPSVLTMIVNFKTFDKVKPQYLKKIMFLGEVMPTKQFNQWRKALPEIAYANIYGPTEATGDCTYYKVNREFSDDEPIPIGNACENTEVFLLSEENEIITDDRMGEICVRGCSLALGYYNDPEKTAQAFTQHPLHSHYPERIYHTGDLGKYNQYGEIVYISRKDAQIKHMGHRIELGEIEVALSAVEGVGRAVCVYHKTANRIVAFYEGDITDKEIISVLRDKLPRYMLPNRFCQLDKLPVNANGKIDRVKLTQSLEETK